MATEINNPSSIVIPFKNPPKRAADGVLYVPPPSCDGAVYVVYGKPRAKTRKRRWFIWIQFCDYTSDIEEGPADWKTAMFLARVRATKYGFRVVDVSDSEYCRRAKSKSTGKRS